MFLDGCALQLKLNGVLRRGNVFLYLRPWVLEVRVPNISNYFEVL